MSEINTTYPYYKRFEQCKTLLKMVQAKSSYLHRSH